MGGFIMKKKLLVLVLIITVVGGNLFNSGTYLVKIEDHPPQPKITFNLV